MRHGGGEGLQARRRPAGRRRGPLVALAAVLVVVLVLAAVAAGVRLTHRGEALPGTTVAGVDVAGATADEIRDRLEPVLATDVPLVVLADGEELAVRPSRAGYAVDLDATVDRALDAGRDGFPLGVISTLGGLVGTHDVEAAATVDAGRLRRTVADLAERIDRPSFPGAIEVDPTTLTVAVEDSRPGRRVDRGAMRDQLRAAMLARTTEPVRVDVRERRATSQAELEDVARDAAAYVEQPLTADGPRRTTTVPSERVAEVLALEPVGKGRRVRLGVDEEALAGLAAWIAARYERPARNAAMDAPARPIVVDDKGDVSWEPRDAAVSVSPGRAGRAVDAEALGDRLATAIRNGQHAVDVPVERVEPEVSTAQARTASDVIGTFTSYYTPGEPRVTNIQRIAAAVDGTVIPPGGQFSLNGIAGERTREKGYVPAPFISEGRIVPSVGGGVSQFSTTAYNAAYFAGLPIDAFQAHSLFIDRYPAGRESTLNYPDIDLRWTNDTGAPILVRTSADATSVSVTLYGDNGGRRVRSESGPREPVSGGDFAVTVTRVVRHPDGRTDRQPVTTTYDLPAEEPEG